MSKSDALGWLRRLVGGDGTKPRLSKGEQADQAIRKTFDHYMNLHKQGEVEADRLKALGFDTGARVRFREDYDYEPYEGAHSHTTFHAKAGEEAYVVMVYSWQDKVEIEFFYKNQKTGLMPIHENKLEVVEPAWGLDRSVPVGSGEIEKILAAQEGFTLYDQDELMFESNGRRYTVEIRAWDVTNVRYYNKQGFKKRRLLHRRMFPPHGRIYIGHETETDGRD